MANEKVGPGQPPREYMFKPGHSGNPRGRPPRSRNMATIVFSQLNKKVPFGGRMISRFELMLRAQVDSAVACDPWAVRQVVEQWLTYHSDRPDGVDRDVEHKVVVETHRLLEQVRSWQNAEDGRRLRKARKSDGEEEGSG